MIRKHLPDLIVLALLLSLPLLILAPVALGPKTLLPADNLFLFEPYRAAAADLGVAYPQNHLVSDLILQNYAWKHLIVTSLQDETGSIQDKIPFWDPYIFSGHPFLANGQHSALYPLSVVFYILPLWRAYGIFVWLQLGLAGVFTYLFARVLGIRRLGGLIAGIAFQLSGFMVVSSIPHPMIIAAASWLPLVLTAVELIVQQRPALGQRPATLPWALLGALALGCHMLAGHAENTGFTLLVTGAYALWRIVGQAARRRTPTPDQHESASLWGRLADTRRVIVWLAVMVALGLALGAVQFVPYLEVVSTSFRGGEAAASLQQVLEWAYPPRRLITFAMPHFFGSPAHHAYFDLFSWRWTPAQTFLDGQYIDWGIKNYVEGGAYLGLLPLSLAVIAIMHQFTNLPITNPPGKWYTGRLVIGKLVNWFRHPHVPFFTLLALFSLACIFGTPLYALVYALPFFNQSHSPFRWVFPLTLCVAVLAGFGIEAVRESRRAGETRRQEDKETRGKGTSAVRFVLLNAPISLTTVFAAVAFWGGVAVLVGLALSRTFFTQIEPLVERLFLSLARAPEAFPDHRAFYSYEFPWIALFGLLLVAAGIVLRVSRCPIFIRRRPVWEILAVGVLVVDLVAWGTGFAPAVDPALLDHVPPVVQFLQGDTDLWRYATFTPIDPETKALQTTKTMNANVGMHYGLQAVDGYDSLFTAQYRDYMALIEPQGETPYNRIASFHRQQSLDSPLTDLLNVKYVVTEVTIESPKFALVYQDDAVQVYENLGAMDRAFTLPISATVTAGEAAQALRTYDPRYYVILDKATPDPIASSQQPATGSPQTITGYTNNEVTVMATVSETSWLVLTDAYFPGWKAFVQPAGDAIESEVAIHRVDGTFRGVLLEPGAWTVRFKYSPDSVKIGAFVSFTAGMGLLFLAGLYMWRFFYREEDDATTVRRVAKNSIAPIVLNLFIKAIDFAFGMLMARTLGPGGVGRYVWAVQAFLWFDVVANFGLEMYVMREVARDRDRTRLIFANSTVLRLLLLLGVAPAAAIFLGGWQAAISPLEPETAWTLVLLCVSLLPSTLSNSLTAVFRAYEKHEYPAAVQTATAIIKVVLGTLVLVGGLGIVGLAGTVILTNVATLVILAVLARSHIWASLPPDGRRAGGVAWPLQRAMLAESWPIMASMLLQTLFPTVNVLMLKPPHGDEAIGWYDAGYKWLNALQIIPAYFIPGVFPVLARQAAQDRGVLRQSYRLSIKLLMILVLPAAVLITLLATPLVGFLSGAEFLPHGAVALRILIWSAAFGWINSLTNYVLIALDRQRFVMLASAARVAFTLVANLLFVGSFSYVASAWVIVGGELLLVLLFYADLRRQLGPVGWVQLLWRTALAALLMGGLVWGLSAIHPVLALLGGAIIYPAALILLRALTPEEWAALAPLIPEPVRRVVPTAQRPG